MMTMLEAVEDAAARELNDEGLFTGDQLVAIRRAISAAVLELKEWGCLEPPLGWGRPRR